MEERVVNVPLMGGLNEGDDVFSVQPPEMLLLRNVQSVVKGALDSRPGFELVTRTTDKRPALTFTTPTGALTAMPNLVEAISSNASTGGTRAVVAAGGKFYDWVGGESNRGWREVNDLPEHVGTLTSTSSTGGSIIETESFTYDDDTKRITFWVTGKRTGQELSSDRMMLDQVNGDGNSVYYSVQVMGSDAYIVPPTRLNNAAGTPVVSAQNLRIIKLNASAATGSAEWPMAFWWNRATNQIEYVVISPDTGARVAATQNLPRFTAFNLVNTHRNFDVCALPANAKGQVPTILFARCEEDQAGVRPAYIEASLATVSTTTAAVTIVDNEADILHRTAPTVTPAFRPYANRGIMLNQRPTTALTPVAPDFVNWQASISYAARVVARYWTPADGGSATNRLDGQLVAGNIQAGYTDTTSTWSLDWFGGKYIPLIGFQTSDNLTGVLSTPQAPVHKSASPNTRTALETVVSVASALPTPGPWVNVVSENNSEWAIAVQLIDGTSQTYMCDVAQTNLFSGNLYTIAPKASKPYASAIAAGADQSDGRYYGANTAYPVQPARQYPGDLPMEWSLLPQPSRQVQFLEVPAPGVANTGWTVGVHTSCNIFIGADIVATATIVVANVDPLNPGSIVACAIENPLAGTAPGGYPFAGAATAPWVAPVTTITGCGVGTLTGANVYNITHGVIATPDGQDIPDVGNTQTGTSFYYIGQQEHCVHRWAISQEGEKKHIIALSSASATPMTNPQGDSPFGAVSPHKLNNFLEVYGYTEVASKYYEPLVPFNSGTSSALKCALGGPWRLLSDIYRREDGRCYMAATVAGDDSQASTFLLRFNDTQTSVISWPGGSPNLELAPYPTAEATSYVGNAGMFVEAANMMRVTAPVLNVPSLHLTQDGLTLGGLRNGSSKGVQESFAIDYEYLPQNWRQMVRMSDYTFVNGGILSVFDGVNCNEHGVLVWPQRDLTSISWGDDGAQLRVLASDSYRPFQWLTISGVGFSQTFTLLNNITKPYWFYEAGLRCSRVATGIFNFGRVNTKWGGDPSDNYEAVYADVRVQQFSQWTKTSSNGGASILGPHYYGRFQNGGSGFSTSTPRLPAKSTNNSYFLWAPRAAAGWSNPYDTTTGGNRESSYTQSEAGGDFLMAWCYEYADGTGRIVRSCPSSPIQYTVNAEVYSSDPDAPIARGKIRAGGLVTQFKWGFYVPRLELTNRLNAASEDPRRVTLQPYSTCEPYSTVMYRMPWQNFLNPINDFVVPRNATRGVVPYASRPFDATGTGNITDNPCGLVVSNVNKLAAPPDYANAHNGIFDGPTGDYNGMLREPYLYTTGGVLDNVAPPGCKSMCVHQNRLVVGGADDATVVWFTKELSPTDSPGFNDALTLTIEAGGAVTGLASMNSSLFVFKENDIYVVAGTMPDATGQSSSLSEPTRLPHGIGCVEPKSVLSTPIGVFFQSFRGVELLTPDLQINFIGDKIRQRVQVYPEILSISHNHQSEEVYIVCATQKVTRTDDNIAAIVLVYSYMSNSWYEWTLQDLADGAYSNIAMTVIGSRPWVAIGHTGASANGGYIYEQGNSYVDGLANNASAYNYAYPSVQWQTAPFALNQVQGFQRVKRIRLLATRIYGTTLAPVGIRLETDGAGNQQLVSFTESQLTSIFALQGGLLQLETHVAQQKGQLLSMAAQTTAPSVVDTTAVGYRFSNLALVVGLKSGLNKRITEEAKH
jgi:hypothetical protein